MHQIANPHVVQRCREHVTHDLIGGDGGRNTDLRATAQRMDVTAVNIYLPLQNALRLPEPPAEEMAGLGPDWSRDYGACVASWKADLARRRPAVVRRQPRLGARCRRPPRTAARCGWARGRAESS
ncbi:hypothetical protein AB0L65_42010 [Nonomuraea sp. NPDC052116]|uniref:hypothetical protein n=1 Tax=Nonomuraea sp. NPDC052116 TaxID=3155665 RepID=UPI0034472796